MTILSARAVADMLGMTRHHLNSMAAAGEIPAAKVAGKWVFIEDQLIGWLRANHHNPFANSELMGTCRLSPFFVFSRKIVALGRLA